MSGFEKKEVIQAILIVENNESNFGPFAEENTTALLPLVNVAMLDYALEALNRSSIEEVFVYVSEFMGNVREHIRKGIAASYSWSVNMKVHVIGGEGCRCLGDAMRDLDSKGLLRGHFILLNADTVTNADLRAILEQHKKTAAYDKGAAATLIFMEAATHLRTGNEVMIAMDTQNNRLHYHQRLRLQNKESHFEVPLEVFMQSSRIALLHNLLDPQIAIGSPSMLSLFSDNFDFETRDEFVRGILINEEILDSRIYVSILPKDQYARKVNNWLAYQIVSLDIINRWAYPLVPDMGIHSLWQQYIFLKNNIYKSPMASLNKAVLHDNVVVQINSHIDTGVNINCSVIGANCIIRENCQLKHAFLMDGVVLENDCVLEYCVVGNGVVIGAKSILLAGTVVASKSIIPKGSKLEKVLVTPTKDNLEDVVFKKLGAHAFVVDDAEQLKPVNNNASDSEDECLIPPTVGVTKMQSLPLTLEESDYYTSSDEEDESQQASPLPDDTNIFLSEVLDSLSRGFQEKSNPDFLILEINSSRYAYNMSLQEVNFNVVKAIFSLQIVKEPPNQNVLIAIHNVLKQLGPVLTNYIKTDDAMLDCLKALEDICEENKLVQDKISQIVHYLYDKDFVSEDAIISWYELLDEEEHAAIRNSLAKLVEWLNQSSDEEDEEHDDDDE